MTSQAIAAWGLLAVMDIVARVAGFSPLYKLVAACPTMRPRKDEHAQRLKTTCASVDRAKVYYFKHAWCLQSAVTATCLLRLRGIAADFVVGVRRMPFEAHAWVEVDRQVVMNARPDLRDYRVITRC